MTIIAHPNQEGQEARGRVSVALPPGAATLLGQPATGGLTWAGRFPHQAAAIIALLRRALAIDESDE